jgi:hypothetical protein
MRLEKIFFNDKSGGHTNHNWLPDNNYVFLISFIILLLSTIWIISTHPLPKKKLNLLLKTRGAKINLGLILVFIVYSFTFFRHDSYMVKATKTGIYAMIIAICAFLEIPLIPFWFTHIMVYFSQDWVKVA